MNLNPTEFHDEKLSAETKRPSTGRGCRTWLALLLAAISLTQVAYTVLVVDPSMEELRNGHARTTTSDSTKDSSNAHVASFGE